MKNAEHNGDTQWQWGHTVTMGTRSDNGDTQWQWRHTVTMGTHSGNGLATRVLIDRWVFTLCLVSNTQHDRLELHRWRNVSLHFMAHLVTVRILYESVGCRELTGKSIVLSWVLHLGSKPLAVRRALLTSWHEVEWGGVGGWRRRIPPPKVTQNRAIQLRSAQCSYNGWQEYRKQVLCGMVTCLLHK
jgi:hypothetical protein